MVLPAALPLAQALIRCPSITPADAGVMAVLESALQPLGFVCRRLRFADAPGAATDNLYARLGSSGPNFCFAGHVDVVPPGTPDGWSVDPFAATVAGDRLFGRGAADMKGAVAAFVAGVAAFLERYGPPPGSISLLITGDEEGDAVNGTRKVLDWLATEGERLDACVVGEPTNPSVLGEMIKIGRRGSLNARLTVHGTQGHAAYPDLADNPLPRLVRMLAGLTASPLDQGTSHFQPSTLALTSIDVGNPASNVIPSRGSAAFNIRFNDRHSSASLNQWLHEQFDAVGGRYDLDLQVSGEAFLTPPGRLSGLVSAAVARVTGRQPQLSTSGGTSDARFIHRVCPVVEFGLVGASMHKADEHVALADLARLAEIYAMILDDFFRDSMA